MADDRGGGDD